MKPSTATTIVVWALHDDARRTSSGPSAVCARPEEGPQWRTIQEIPPGEGYQIPPRVYHIYEPCSLLQSLRHRWGGREQPGSPLLRHDGERSGGIGVDDLDALVGRRAVKTLLYDRSSLSTCEDMAVE